jgi:nitrogen regulatory protein P-II 2
MQLHPKKLVVILCEAVLEPMLVADCERLGAHGYTVMDARGGGRRGARAATWDADRSIRMEVICDDATASAIIEHVHQRYFVNYAMTVFAAEIGVLRADKF